MRSVSRNRFSRIIGALLVATAGLAAAQEYPDRPIRFVVPSTGGSSPDHVGRIMAAEMSRILGQAAIVDNKVGADGMVAYEYVAKQVAPDGYTVGVVTIPALASLPATVKELRFDPLKDLPPIIAAAETQYIFGSPASSPWKTFRDMVAHAKANPGKLNYGFFGANLRLLTEVVIQDQALRIVNVPYRAGGPYIQAVITGEVQMGFLGESSAKGHGERFRALATTGERRRPLFPDVPTFAELGYPQIRGPGFSLNVPVGVPKPIFDKLYAAATRALKAAEVKERFANVQFEIMDLGPEAAGKRLFEEAQLFSAIAKQAGINPQ